MVPHDIVILHLLVFSLATFELILLLLRHFLLAVFVGILIIGSVLFSRVSAVAAHVAPGHDALAASAIINRLNGILVEHIIRDTAREVRVSLLSAR